MIFTLLGILSGLLIVIADIPYALNAYRRKTQPHRVTWFIVFILNIIGFANQLASGATNSLWLFGGAIIATFCIFILSLTRGVGGHTSLDIAILVGAALGLVLWWLLNSPLISIVINVALATAALVPTYLQAYRRPESETKITWLIATISALCATISVGKLNYVLLILPVYAVIAQAGLFIILELRGRQLAAP